MHANFSYAVWVIIVLLFQQDKALRVKSTPRAIVLSRKSLMASVPASGATGLPPGYELQAAEPEGH